MRNRKNVEGQIKSMVILEQRYCMPRVLKNYYLLRQLSKEINLGTLIKVQLNNLYQRMNPRPKVIYKGVLSTGRLWLDLWFKDQNCPFENSFSNNFSVLAKCGFPFKFFFEKILFKKPCNFEPFCYVINCVLLRRKCK